MDKYNKTLGKAGEDAACNLLQKQGYTIVEQNYSCKIGEVDIIAQKDNYLVFIEVKTRSGNTFGTPSEAVGYTKKKKIKNVILQYLTNNNKLNFDIRFDVIEVIAQNTEGRFLYKEINHIENVIL